MMYQGEAEILYPSHVTPSLRSLRGQVWRQLIDNVLSHADDSDVALAFSLMMIRLGGCMTCTADSYRAMRGCASCAYQTIRRYKGSDEQLVSVFEEARRDIVDSRETGNRLLSEQASSKVQ
jgi:hypothetical protein